MLQTASQGLIFDPDVDLKAKLQKIADKYTLWLQQQLLEIPDYQIPDYQIDGKYYFEAKGSRQQDLDKIMQKSHNQLRLRILLDDSGDNKGGIGLVDLKTNIPTFYVAWIKIKFS